MKRKLLNIVLGQVILCLIIACQSQKSNLRFEKQGDTLTTHTYYPANKIFIASYSRSSH